MLNYIQILLIILSNKLICDVNPDMLIFHNICLNNNASIFLILGIQGGVNKATQLPLIVYFFAERSLFTKIFSWKMKKFRPIKNLISLVASIRMLQDDDKYSQIYFNRKKNCWKNNCKYVWYSDLLTKLDLETVSI